MMHTLTSVQEDLKKLQSLLPLSDDCDEEIEILHRLRRDVAAMQEMISPSRWTRLSGVLAVPSHPTDPEQDVFENLAEKLFARL